MDWRQLWEICSAPDNVPIVGLIPLLAFYIYLAVKQARANDVLIAQLEADPAMAKTHHRKTWPFKPGWAKEVHVWPFLLRVEFLGAIIVTIILMVWSITLNAPMEEPANPNLTMNPAKAPWYFLGLQEQVSYSAFWGGVGVPAIELLLVMLVPFIDRSKAGQGRWFARERFWANSLFLTCVLINVVLIIIGTFFRGANWSFGSPF
jgi:quinol-cytochrome oxidoreductase complex cytochrome b subunit